MKCCRLACIVVLSLSTLAPAQVQFLGRVLHPRFPEAADKLPTNNGVPEDYFAPDRPGDPAEIMPLCNVRCFASVDGPGIETMAARTWELAPSGWYRMTGSAGRTTMLFTGPSVFMQPTVFTNIFTKPGETIDRKVVPNFDYAVLFMGAWDDKPATDYYQTFTATGTSVTQVGFRLASDGVDGEGPGSQTLLVSVHRQGPGTPDTWQQIGPAVPVPNVDCGGPKNYDWLAGWNSGEVPTEPGRVYAVHLKAEKDGNTFQAFWRPNEKKINDCYRLGPRGQTGWVGHNLCMVIATDNSGLVIPYNKRVQKEYVDFAGFARKWSQSYVAQGRSLAGALLYMANSGVQPSVARQRAVVRLRQDGPDGPVVGVEKVAIGNGIHTGDASWGVYGLAYSPGEVPLEPGKTYAIEFESIENYESLHGYVNIKGMVSDDKPGFNPYKKVAPDNYENGTAYKNGKDDAGFDLDMQIIEYRREVTDWHKAVDPQNLLVNGDMEAGQLDEKDPGNGRIEGWRTFSADPGTIHHFLADPPENKSRILRVTAGKEAKAVDGGYVQKVTGLKRLDTYRLSGKVRSSWSVDVEHYSQVGYDPTGQDSDPKAPTIVWTPLPGMHSIWVEYHSEPIRPAGDSISVWLRGWARSTGGTPFKADFDEFSLRRVKTQLTP
ncbi:MAG TPA: hypothetical protein PLL20_02330 [Phycisphaerae bacterium]|nr:hypothetical protein [Phycisphaerae bacterium]HRR84199.1 hypothetical protein [Phycisphaerae bacterium]